MRKFGLFIRVKKAQLIALIIRKIFSCNDLEMTIDTMPNGDKKIYIFDRDTMIDYEWIALWKEQQKITRDDKTTVEWFPLRK